MNRIQKIAHDVEVRTKGRDQEEIKRYVRLGFLDTEVALKRFDQALTELESTLALSQRTFRE